MAAITSIPLLPLPRPWSERFNLGRIVSISGTGHAHMGDGGHATRRAHISRTRTGSENSKFRRDHRPFGRPRIG